MTNNYDLTDGKNTITIISDMSGHPRGNNRLMIGFLSIELAGGELRYKAGGFVNKGFVVVRLEPGRPYEHLFEGIKISSRDQKTFYIEM